MRTLLRAVFIGSLALICLQRPASAETFPCTFHSRFPSFTLSSNPMCRASIEVGHKKICLNQELWAEWLTAPKSPLICGSLSGNWKLTAPLSIETSDSPKKIFSSFRLKSLPILIPNLNQSSAELYVPLVWKQLQLAREKLSQRLAPLDSWGIYRSILLDERNPNGPLSFLRLIGFFHLFNASGVHLCAIALFIGWASRRVFLCARLSAHPAIQISRFVTVAFWALAWTLCGCRIGMLRPILMVSARQLSQSLGFKWIFWTPFVLSFLFEMVCAFYRGGSIFGTARLDVALAVGGFLLMLQKDSASKERSSHGYAIVGGWIFVSFAQSFHSQTLSLFAPILGLLTLPLFCSITYPWLLIESIWGTSTPIGDALIHGSLWVLHIFIEWTLRLPNLWVISKSTLVLSWVASLGWIIFSFYLPSKSRFLVLAPILLVMVALRSLDAPTSSNSSLAKDVIQLDVGQGDSAMVLSQASLAGLVDVGSAHSLSDAQWLQTFSQAGVMELSWVGLTHLDEDHAGGLERLSRLIPIHCVASSSQEVWSERGQRLARRLLSRGVRLESWDAGYVPYPVYQPLGHSHGASGNSMMSAVLVPLQSGDYYLSAGDVEGSDEVTIFKWADQRANGPGQRVLKISHHGSNTSSDPQALKLFHPDFAVISVGLGNSYGHPAVEVMQRLSELKIPVHRTDLMGPFRAGDVLHRPLEHRP